MYKKSYYLLFNEITNAIEMLDKIREQLKEAQRLTEEIYISEAAEPVDFRLVSRPNLPNSEDKHYGDKRCRSPCFAIHGQHRCNTRPQYTAH